MLLNSINDGLNRCKPGINPFKIDHNWYDPAEGLPRKGRKFSRTDPLQCPALVPPRSKTHCHGRWISTQGSSKCVWVDYEPCPLPETLIIPHNTTMTNPHWKFRTLLDGTNVKDVSEVVDMIAKDRTRRGLVSRSSDPTGPPMRQLSGFVDPNQRTRIHDRADFLNNITDMMPHDAAQRTPLRYTTYAPEAKSAQRSGNDRTTTSHTGSVSSTSSMSPSSQAAPFCSVTFKPGTCACCPHLQVKDLHRYSKMPQLPQVGLSLLHNRLTSTALVMQTALL